MITALFYQFFAALCGWLEALLYARRGAEAFNSNEHGGMMWQRAAAFALAPAAVADYVLFGWWALAGLPTMTLLFPLSHDEAYNFTRLWIDAADHGAVSDKAAWRLAWGKYEYGYQSPTTTARNDFTGRQRTFMAAAAAALAAGAVVIVFMR